MANAPTCYFPDGSVASRDTPCNSYATSYGASACCAYQDVCLDNHLCIAQSGAEVISRGSCTDRTWQSSECCQYCADGNRPLVQIYRNIQPSSRNDSANIVYGCYEPQQWHRYTSININGHPLFCCSQVDASNDTCMVGTEGSTAPFFIQAGLVIVNRTSGSTSLDNANTISATVTVTATATASALSSSSTKTAPSFSSSSKSVAIGAGVGGLLGLGLIVALGLLWIQRKHKRSLRNDALTWMGRYTELKETVDLGRAEHHPPHQLDGLKTNELDARSHLPRQPHSSRQLECWTPEELHGAQIHELADRV